MKTPHLLVLFVLVSMLFAFPGYAHAYIDPGTGSVVLQLLLAGFAGIGIVVKLGWRKIISPFKRQKLEDSEPPNSAAS